MKEYGTELLDNFELFDDRHNYHQVYIARLYTKTKLHFSYEMWKLTDIQSKSSVRLEDCQHQVNFKKKIF